METIDRSRYRNPSPPPGYVRPNPHIALKPDLVEIDGQIYKFLALTIESGILDDSNPSSDFTVPASDDDDDDDVQHIPISPKLPPVIDLDVECLELSDGEILDTPEASVIEAEIKPKRQRAKTKEIYEARHHSKAAKKDLPPPAKVKKHHSKKEKVVEYSSYSSSESSHSKKRKKTKKRRHSRSCSSSVHDSSDYNDNKYPAYIKQEDNLFGHFHCAVCKLTMNAESPFQSHLLGKRHIKAVKAQKENVAQSMEDALLFTKMQITRYPAAPPNVVRMRVQETALVQRVVEDRVETPCPGLHKVIEIQGMDETHYYCELCDAPCSSNSLIPHLRGRKHQLMCLKFFDERTYDSIKDKTNRKEVDILLHKLLKNVQKSHGLGRMTVERDMEYKDRRDSYRNNSDRPQRRHDIPGPSHRYDEPEDRMPESLQDTMKPDISKSDFYCKICDSHMNNINMWQAHVTGKRHLKNVKKGPGEGPSKTKSYHRPNARALVMDDLEHVMQPVVGLDYIRETQNPEVGGAIYNCFLCGACMTQLDIVDHILTQKHRTKFLEKIEHPDMLMMSQMNIQGSHLGSIIAESCSNVEKNNGRGNVEVYVMKNAVGRW